VPAIRLQRSVDDDQSENRQPNAPSKTRLECRKRGAVERLNISSRSSSRSQDKRMVTASQCGRLPNCVSHLVTDQTPKWDNQFEQRALTNFGMPHGEVCCWFKAGAELQPGRHQRTAASFFLHLRSRRKAYMMDPQDTPGYRLHRALSNLTTASISSNWTLPTESESLRPRRFWNK